MPPKDTINLGAGVLTFNGYPISVSGGGPTVTVEAPEEPKHEGFSATYTLVDEVSFTGTARLDQYTLATLLGVAQAVFDMCPNRRVIHLAKHARKARTRKKNRHRAFEMAAI